MFEMKAASAGTKVKRDATVYAMAHLSTLRCSRGPLHAEVKENPLYVHIIQDAIDACRRHPEIVRYMFEH